MARSGWCGNGVGRACLAWGIVVSATVVAQDKGGPWLASPQGVCATCPAAAGGPGTASCGASMRLKQLVRMSPCELEQLYSQGSLAAIPPGAIRGQALLNPGTKLAVPSSSVSRLAWQGKVFETDGCRAINRFFGVRMIKANVYTAESWRDGRPALILDYSQTSLLYAPYRDEIRQVAPGLFLGLMFDRRVCPPKLKMYFALECTPDGCH
jgi:hypothetical protein